MNKLSLLALLAIASTPLSLAKESGIVKPSVTPAATAPTATARTSTKKASEAEAAVVEQFVHLQDAAITSFLELGDTLREVKDEESANAAVPAVNAAGTKLCDIISQVQSLGEPSEAAQQAIMARVANVAEKNEIIEQVMVPLLTLMMQNPPCYGSNALYDEISLLLENLQGAAGVEEADDNEVAPLQEPDADETADATAK